MTDTWTCFGDPSVIVRTQAPETMAVSYNPAIPVGSTSLDVSCSTEGALVSLTLDGEIIGTAVVAGGMTTVNFDALSSIGDITVTVTALNTTPEIGTTSVVVLDGPWLVVTSYELNGDEDGMFSFGESYDLHFTVENIGTEATSEINIGTTVDGPIELSSFGDNIPGIAAGESYTYSGMYFPTSVMNSIIDGDEGVVNFSMSSEEGTWNSSISIPLHAPALEVTNVDAQLMFGETTTANITLTNNGSSDFAGGLANLNIDGSYLSVLNNVEIDALASGASITLAFDVMLDADAPSSTLINATLFVSEGVFEQSSDLVFDTPMCQSSDLDIELTIMTDTWGSETSWNFTNADGVVLASLEAGDYESSSTYTAAVCAAEGTIMTFNIADSYGDGIYSPNGYWITVCGNEVAQGDAFGSGTSETFLVTCDVLVEIMGCMDPEADNYNSEANVDDGSCVYTIDCDSATALQLIMSDSYGDGWNGNYFELYDIDGNQLVTTTLESGSSGTYDFCLNDGCYSIVTTDSGSWTSEVSWSLVDATGSSLATGLSPSSTSISLNQDCGFVTGCTDASACNYNSDANVDDGSCVYAATYYDCDGNCISDIDSDGICDELEIYGCMDQTASNYNPNATEEDGSCLEPIDCEGLTNVTISMLDSYGDGWNGNILTINSQTFTIDSGSEGVGTACIDLSLECIAVTCDGGSWQSEVSWTISEGDAIFLSGGAPYSGGIGDCGGSDVYGCTDATALNYNPEATIDDGSCSYEECICPEIWDPVCGLDGITYSNSCEAGCVGIDYIIGECEVVMGCTDATALNYNPEATEDDGSCEYDSTGCTEGQIEDCNGNCAPSSWVGDGVCDDGNYTSGGNLIYFTCEEFDFDGGDCGGSDVYGCTDAAAINYNAEANTDDGSCEYEQTVGPWEVLITGSNHTIAVGGDTPITIEDMPIENGDWIGVFYTDDNGDLQCAGYAEWNSETTAIAAQGDDSTTDEIDGLQTGETFIWMIWDASTDLIYSANASYLAGMPSGSDFVINGITGLESLHTAPAVSEQIIELLQGWSLFSTYMLTDNMDVVEMLTAINSEIVIVKDNAGLAYLPEWGFNGIGEMIVGQGYQIKLTSASTLIVEGQYMEPEENPITLTEGWNMFGCLRLEGSDVSSVFADIVDDVVIVKNGEGLAYLPEWAFNGIGNIEPGQGYQAKMNTTQTLNYLPNDQEYRLADVSIVNNSSLRHFSKVIPTGNNMQLLIEDEAWDKLPIQESEIAVLDKYGTVVGSATYTSPVTVVTVWGDDMTTSVKDGLAISEEVSFKLWSSEGVCDFIVSEWKVGSSNYYIDGINIAGTIQTSNDMTILDATEIKLLRVIDVLGRDIDSNSDTFNGKVIFKVYDDGTVEKIVL